MKDDKGLSLSTTKKKVMPTKAPIKSEFKAPDLTTRIPEVRPTSMRNLGPWKGLKK